MTTSLNISCSENTMVLSGRRGFLHACIFQSTLEKLPLQQVFNASSHTKRQCLAGLINYSHESVLMLTVIYMTISYHTCALIQWCHFNNMTTCSIYLLCSILQKSRNNGAQPFYQLHIYICCERIVLFLRNMFKFPGHSQFPEVCATSKKIMLFHDNGFVLLRFACDFN